jgi:mannosyl-3-phosphoglycerate phosphatase family protein
MNADNIIIFTDLDGSLLNHDDFQFKKIKNFILDCLKCGIKIIPNSSKTKIEIEIFSNQLGEQLPFIVENGAAVHNLDLLNVNLKSYNNSIVFSRTIDELIEVFNKKVPATFKDKCLFIKDMKKQKQKEILGLNDDYLPYALNRGYSTPFVFNGCPELVDEFKFILENLGMKLHEGGRVFNISDNCSKGSALNTLVNKLQNDLFLSPYVIAVGDSPNDISMLKEANQPCVVPLPNKSNLNNLKIHNILRAKQCAPEGWEEVIRLSLKKININLIG